MSKEPKKPSEIPPYSGWRPRSMRFGKHRHEGERKAKREQLGNSRDRAIYKSAHGYKNPRWGVLCRIADLLNGK